MKLTGRVSRTLIAASICLTFSFGCVDTPATKDSSSPSVKKEDKIKKAPDKEASKVESFVISGRVVNVHTEYFHTFVGFRTADNRLLNLIFPGVFMQFGPGLYCKVTYHRLNDTDYLPELLRSQKANYFYLDNVELLDDNVGADIKEGKR